MPIDTTKTLFLTVGHTVKRCPQANAGNEGGGLGGFDNDNTGYGNNEAAGVDTANGDSWVNADAANGDGGAAADSGWMNAGAAADTWATAPVAATTGGW